MFLQTLRLLIVSLCLFSMNTFAKVESSFRFVENGRSDYLFVEAVGNVVSIYRCQDEANCDQITAFERIELERFVADSKRGSSFQKGLNYTAGLSLLAAGSILYFTITSSDSNIPVQLLAVPVLGVVSAFSTVCSITTAVVRRGARENRNNANLLNDGLVSCDLDQTEVTSLNDMEKGILELEKKIGF